MGKYMCSSPRKQRTQAVVWPSQDLRTKTHGSREDRKPSCQNLSRNQLCQEPLLRAAANAAANEVENYPSWTPNGPIRKASSITESLHSYLISATGLALNLAGESQGKCVHL
ncbi:hypothetical protein AOXY_G38220 [Acipenser oxyrinchus oxyrinchus]|uniref:Uncharacterized protein n=1 Tax=Acipenser oxyrinchus oxyrinchus TaxID=40147 RepID=A0AAD8CDM1_ACIOX|nr:hypothetical protein AOXY_G38220 [Acipenser oxyrinchus oxyrinchus]